MATVANPERRGNNAPVGPLPTNDREDSPDPVTMVVDVSDAHVKIIGIDCIYHNMDSRSTFLCFRKWYPGCDVDSLLLFISDHVRQGLYSIIALNITVHMVVVTMATQKNRDEFPLDWFKYPPLPEAASP